MSSPTKEERWAKIHSDALTQFDAIQRAIKDERMQCLQDRRFYSIPGAMWEGLEQQFENKPKFEINKIHGSVIRKISEYRNNRIDVQFVTKDGSDSGLSETCEGLYRADCDDSRAEEAHDNAFEEAVGGGFGAFRLIAEYEGEDDQDDDDQRIRIEPIYDADSCVFFDLSAKTQDKSDANFCFVLTAMTHDAYKDEFDQDPTTMPKSITQTFFDWTKADLVYIAEYYIIEKKKESVQTWTDASGAESEYSTSDFKADPELLNRLQATGQTMTDETKATKKQVHKYLMDGNEILEDCGIIAGKNIPIIPVYGKRWFVDGIERSMGDVRLKKDAQRLKNMATTMMAETMATGSRSKPILPSEMMTGHEKVWADDNIKNYSWLPINALRDLQGNIVAMSPPAFTQPPQISAPMAAILQMVEADIQDMQGNPQNVDKVVSNISAEAMSIAQTNLDVGNFIFISNFAKALRRSGAVYLSMAKELYTTGPRAMKTMASDGTVGSVKLMQPMQDPDKGPILENDLTEANFDVSVSIGPSSRNAKQAAVKAFTVMLQALGAVDPNLSRILAMKALQNIESDDMDGLDEYLRQQLVQAGAEKPNPEEQQQIDAQNQQAQQPQQPDPTVMAQLQLLQAAAEQAQADAMKARADVVNVIADSEKTHAQTLQILQTMQETNRESYAQLLDALNTAVKVPSVQ